MKLPPQVSLIRVSRRFCSSQPSAAAAATVVAQPSSPGTVDVGGFTYPRDAWTNVTPHIASLVGRDLHNSDGHPICLLKRRVFDFFHSRFRNARGNPVFSAHDSLFPVVTPAENFDSLLIGEDHPSRARKDNYYVNARHLLRSHTSAHQVELLRMGCDDFLVAGDVYRRDAVDSTHYPVFHQIEGLRTFTTAFVSGKTRCPVFRDAGGGERTPRAQETHSEPTAAFVEADLKRCLGALCDAVLGEGVERRWVDAYFPFTHPSWELEVRWPDREDWVEMLGCGVVEQRILSDGTNEDLACMLGIEDGCRTWISPCHIFSNRSGIGKDRVGWAFGIGLERWAMKLYSIPDIRLFWTSDTGFLNQFKGKNPEDKITYKPISVFPQCKNDISFWLPDGGGVEPNDFYDLVRSVGEDMVEQVELVDEFFHPKRKAKSQTYSIVYRSMTRTLTQEEVNEVHKNIESAASERLKVKIR